MLKALLFILLLISTNRLSSEPSDRVIPIINKGSHDIIFNSYSLPLLDSIPPNASKTTKKKKRTTGHKILVGMGGYIGLIGASALVMGSLLALGIIKLP